LDLRALFLAPTALYGYWHLLVAIGSEGRDPFILPEEETIMVCKRWILGTGLVAAGFLLGAPRHAWAQG
jgi:hypothetical protein